MLPTLQRLAATEGVLDRIRFLCDRTDIPALLGNADIFVLPSRYEGFGLVLLEAMAAGVPVVAADVDGGASMRFPSTFSPVPIARARATTSVNDDDIAKAAG